MSRGAGSVQRGIIAAFEAAPGRRFTVEELAAEVYLGQEIERKHLVSVRRALDKVVPKLGLARSRAGKSGQGGWRYRIGLPGK